MKNVTRLIFLPCFLSPETPIHFSQATSSLPIMHSALLSELSEPSNIYSTIDPHLRPIVQFVPVKLEDLYLQDQSFQKQLNGWRVGLVGGEEHFHEWERIENEMEENRSTAEAGYVQCGAEYSGE